MAYKGDDLDLRAPQSRSAGGQPLGGYVRGEDEGPSVTARQRPRGNGYYQNGAQRSPALYVDETLLACCNHAYDIASANGAREVLLEHLVHALTRVPEAAQILESRGVHVMALRRESAAIIANDFPITASDSGGQVRASSDFDAVLHLAAANARLRSDRPTSVRDVLFVLMNYDRQASGIDLLRRHWATWQQDEDRDEPLRVAPPTGREPRLDLRQPVIDPAPMLERGEMLGLRDRLWDPRIEALVANLHDAVVAQRAESQSLRSALADRLNRLEKAIEIGRSDGGASAVEIAISARLQRLEKMQETILAQRMNLAPLEAAIGDRLLRLEKAVEAVRLEQSKGPSGLNDRLLTLERHLTERMQGMEKALESATDAMPSGLVDRMEAMESSFEGKITDGLNLWGSIGERLQGLERSLQSHRTEIAQSLNGGSQIQSILSERTQAMERMIENWRQESAAASARLPGQLLDRLGNVENMLATWREDMMTSPSGGEVPGGLFERLQLLERTVADARGESLRMATTNEVAVEELRATVAQLGSDQRGLSEAIGQWRNDTTDYLGIISNKLEAIEHSSVRPVELLESLNARAKAANLQSETTIASPTVFPASTRARTGGQRRGFWRWLFGLS